MKYLIPKGTVVHRFTPDGKKLYDSGSLVGWQKDDSGSLVGWQKVVTDLDVCFDVSDKYVNSPSNVSWEERAWKMFYLPKQCEPWTILEVFEDNIKIIK